MLKLFGILCCLFAAGVQGSVMLALRQRNTDVLMDAFLDVSDPTSPNYGKYWSQERIDSLVSPPQLEVNRLRAYLSDMGIDCKQLGAALECSEMPCLNSLSGLIDFVETHGMIYAPRYHVGNGDGYVAREVLMNLYNVTRPRVTGDNISVCAVEYQGGEGFSNADLQQLQELNGEKREPIAPEHIVGSNEGPDMETQLDVQMMAQLAEGAQIWYWHEPNWVYSFAVQFLNRTVVPDVLSISWGWSEMHQCDPGLGICPNITSAQYIYRTNLEYVKMGLRGISVMVASGDAGACGRTNEGCDASIGVSPIFPGSSPYVTSVGATYIVPSQVHELNEWKTPLCQQYGCVNGTQQMPTNFDVTGWTTGGGFAIYSEHRPTWQDTAVERYLTSGAKMPTHFSREGRGYPDVSIVGHNCPVVSGGFLQAVDGTSCSSPLFAALVALLNDYQASRGKPRLGFVNPVLYKMWEDDPTIFTDVTRGNNWCTEAMCCSSEFGYEAIEGWDPASGLGTPNFGRMVDWLERNT